MEKEHYVPNSVWTSILHFLAFGFGSGAIPFMSGTFGTVAAIPFYLLLQHLSLPVYIAILVVTFVFGVWICGVTERDLGVPDHSGIVWDEMVGYWLTMLAAPTGWQWVVFGFVLFRIFDIWKPFPIRWLDQHVTGGFGIMIDDILAAIYAWIVLQAVALFI